MSLSIPNDFIDPITWGWIENPVVTPCNHVFSKASITRWLHSNKTCPIDRVPIKKEDLVELDEMKERINLYISEHPEVLEAIRKEKAEQFEKEKMLFINKGIKILAPIVLGSTGFLFGISRILSVKLDLSSILRISASISLPWMLVPCLNPDYIVIMSGVSTAYVVLCLTGSSVFAGSFGSSVHFIGKIAIHIGKRIKEGNLGPASLELREAVRYMFP
ncbi:MAG TPA: U-box domain-containing protein [Rhabdochlamydiaceae bacterium]|nr:U-box domain-containing protein [Rhabdochlamydiaceae bacterium]